MSLLQMSIYGAVLILAVVVIRAVAINRLPKKIFLVLWGLVLLRLYVAIQCVFLNRTEYGGQSFRTNYYK